MENFLSKKPPAIPTIQSKIADFPIVFENKKSVYIPNIKPSIAPTFPFKNNPINNYHNLSDFIKENMPQFNLMQIDISQSSFVQKTEKFFKDNIPAEIQKSDVAVAIKNATDNIVSSSNEQMAKFTESLNNNTFATAIRILDSVIAELSFGSLENAEKILERI